MTKKEVASEIMNEFGLTRKDAEAVVTRVLDTVVDGAMAEGRAQCGRHIFTRKVRASRTGRNPKTGEAIQIPERTLGLYKQGIR